MGSMIEHFTLVIERMSEFVIAMNETMSVEDY